MYGVQAVILAIYLTNGIPGLGRFPINFKSEVEETSLLRGRRYFYHVVTAKNLNTRLECAAW